MDEIRFLVQGSADEPYQVRFVKRAKNGLSAYCTCSAGENGQYCKHRVGIVEGGTSGIVSGNEAEVLSVKRWISGSDIEGALVELRAVEQSLECVKAQLLKAKKRLARAMLD